MRVQRVIRAELAMYPGRGPLIARIVLACTIVMVLIMVFRMPGAALGAYYPLLLSRDSPRSTRRSALRTGFVCILGTAEIIFGAMFFVGSPFLHFLWVAGSLFVVFYLISSMTLYDAALALGLIIATGINTWDMPVSADQRLRLTLFTMLSILIGCAVSVAVEYTFAHTHPLDTVIDGVRERLAVVGKLLKGYSEEDTDLSRLRAQLSGLATRGAGHLRERLAHSNYDVLYKERLAAALSLSERLIELAANFAELRPRLDAYEQARCTLIIENIDIITAHLSSAESPEWISLPRSGESAISLLDEIERNVDLIAQSLTDEDHPTHYHLPGPGEQPTLPTFAADAFTNKEHLRFALRGTASALACYLVYMSTGWTGLGASTATCVLTALGNRGASRHKQLMRFAGVILGACVIGFATQALILPQIDSLFAFTILFALVIAVGAWVGTSGPRIGYAGAQIVLAYDLVTLNRFTITTSLVPARDTVLGILLGIFAMWLIFDHLWPTPSTLSMRSLLLSTIREVALFDVAVEPSVASRPHLLLDECERMNTDLDCVRSLIDFSVFEPYPPAVGETYPIECARDLQPQLRSFLMLKTGLLQHHLLSGPCDADDLIRDAKQFSSTMWLELAQIIEDGLGSQSVHAAEVNGLTESIMSTLERARQEGDWSLVRHMQLSASLLGVSQHARYAFVPDSTV